MLLKTMYCVSDALNYAHSNSVLHLNLSASSVLWAIGDIIESQILQYTNPIKRDGLLLTDFGNLAILDIKHQNFNLPSVQKELKYIQEFWPPFVRQQLDYLIGNQTAKDFDKKHYKFLQSLTPKVDIFLFGGLLLQMLNNSINWKSSEELTVENVDKLLVNNGFLPSKVLERVRLIIKRCFAVYDPNNKAIAYNNFYDICNDLQLQFGYIFKRIASITRDTVKIVTAPVKDSDFSKFRTHFLTFCTELYFGNIQNAMTEFKAASKLEKRVGKDNEYMLQLFNFNSLMMKWMKGKISATHIVKNTHRRFSIQLQSHSNTSKNLHKTFKLAGTVPDTRFIPYFEKAFTRACEHYIYKDFNKKLEFIPSSDKASTSLIHLSSANNLLLTASFTTGIKVYGLDLLKKDTLDVKGISCMCASANLLKVVYGTKEGVVSYFTISAKDGAIDQKNLRQLFKHDMNVKLVAISLKGNKAISFGYYDQKLVVYDLEDFTISSVTELDFLISCYSFDFKAVRSVMSFENQTEIILWDHQAPVHRRKLKLTGHQNYVYIVRISYDSQVALSCDLSNKLIFWKLETQTIIREMDMVNVGFIMDLRPTNFFRFIVIKTTQKIIIYEPKFNLIWYEFECDSKNIGLAVELSNPVAEIVTSNDLEIYEDVVNYKQGSPLFNPTEVFQAARERKHHIIKNAITNVVYEKDFIVRFDEIRQIMKQRILGMKNFFAKHDIANPFKMFVAYGKFEGSQKVILRELPLEFAVDIYFDIPSNNENTFLFSSALREYYNTAQGPKMPPHNQFVWLFNTVGLHDEP